MNPKEKLAALLKSMQAIVAGAKASARDLTDAEVADLEAKNAEVEVLKATIARAAKSAALLGSIGGLPAGHAEDAHGNPIKATSWAAKAVAALLPEGRKALTDGPVGVPTILSPALIDAHPRTVLDLIPMSDPFGTRATTSGVKFSGLDGDDVTVAGIGTGNGNGFSYARQTVRDNRAAFVPDLGGKPLSTYTFRQIDDKFRVLAHVTEDLPWRYLGDFGDLTRILATQLRDDALTALERQVLTGDGTGENLVGVLNTSGVQTQAFSSDLLATLSSAKYKLLAQDRAITGWALNPLDLQALEVIRENGATGAFLFRSRGDIEGFLGGPVVTNLGLPVGTAVVADWTQAEVLPMGDDELVFDGRKRTDDNTFRIMYEGRYGLRVKNPFDFVKVTLTAPGED